MKHVHMQIEDYPVDQMEMMESFLKAHFENELLAEKKHNLTVDFLGRKIKELGAEPARYKDEKVKQLWDLVMGVDDENLLPSDDDADVGCYLINETGDENREEELFLAELMRTSTAWENKEGDAPPAGENNTDAEEESRRNEENGDPGPNGAPPAGQNNTNAEEESRRNENGDPGPNDAPPDDSLLSIQQFQACKVP
jgi:hypothetical protein